MDLQSMIDVTSMAKLLDYLHHDASTSGLFQLVDPSLDLVEVAEHFASNEQHSLWQLQTWLKDGKIRMYRSAAIYSDAVPSWMAVDVIRLVPFFIFKPLNKRYE